MKETGKQILIVDDNDMNRKLTTMFLKKLGYQSVAVSGGAEALEIVKKEEFALILMDYRMPDMDGIETAVQVRNLEGDSFKKVPIIALTGDERTEVQQKFLDAGMNDVLLKPLDSERLKEKLEYWIAEETAADGKQDGFHTEKALFSTEGAEPSGEWSAEDIAKLQNAGIFVQEGIKNCGGRELFHSLLEDFYYLIDFKAEKIEKHLAEGHIKEYTIEVHALKNSARLVGAIALSEEFAKQEQLGNQEDIPGVQESLPVLLEYMRCCKNVLAPFMEKNTTGEKEVSNVQLLELLYAMRDAADTFDIDSMDEAMRELETYRWPAECSGYRERLKAYAADVALEDILNEITEIVHILEKTE